MQRECVVGVFPGGAHGALSGLLAALEGAFEVTFVARQPGECRDLRGAIVVDDDGAAVAELERAGVPTYHAPRGQGGGTGPAPVPVTFTSSAELDGRLRARRLREEHPTGATLDAGSCGDVLAATPGGPVWARRDARGAVTHQVASPLVDLGRHERLKDHLAAGRFLSLLPLVQFLREVCEPGWERPALRASFILDDPNLHWRSYGYLRYPQLAAHAARHGYHVGIAMVPLDAVYAHRATVRLFRESPQLSLLVHGNDHVKRELAQPMPHARAVALLAQARSRVAAFERRNGLPVCPVMVPPHYDCSEAMMAAMVETGFEAVCYTGPVGSPVGPLTGWCPADVHLGGGLPGLHRLPFDAPAEELALRAYLDHAILLYGHHTDLAGGIDVLAEAAGRVNELGDVTWTSSQGLARSAYLVRTDGDTTRVRAYSRRLALSPPEGTRHLLVELPPSARKREERVRVAGGSMPARAPTGAAPGLPVAGPAPLVVELEPPASPSSSSPPWRPWPVVRRCLTETRDRVSPLLGVEWSQRQVQ